jgi:tRNA pseudouridine55 synthase
MSELKSFNFLEGELLLVNKPLTWTSFAVVNKLRYAIRHKIGVKKIKVGHAGTLDPLADGLLLICTGKKTKTIDSLMGLEKAYSGTITLGANTPSYDLETEIDEVFDTTSLTQEKIKSEVAKMIGVQAQMPPIFSAKKINGKKAYDLARAGEEVMLKPKIVEINQFEITAIRELEVDFLITCSKGTYIRSIAFDLGKKLGVGGHLTALRREKIGEFDLKNSMTLDEWLLAIETADLSNNQNF